jgi:hypothetical protein
MRNCRDESLESDRTIMDKKTLLQEIKHLNFIQILKVATLYFVTGRHTIVQNKSNIVYTDS